MHQFVIVVRVVEEQLVVTRHVKDARIKEKTSKKLETSTKNPNNKGWFQPLLLFEVII